MTYPLHRVGKGLRRFGGENVPVSPLVSLLSSYSPTGLWDANYYSTLEGKAYEWIDQTGNGNHWVQYAGASLAPAPVTTAGGMAALRFSGAEYLTCNALATLASGDSIPWWLAAAIEGVTRDTTARSLFSLGAAAGSDQRNLVRPNQSASATYNSRVDAGGTLNLSLTTTSRTSGILIARFSGTALKVRWGTSTNDGAKTGAATFAFATLGATKYNAVLNNHFVGDVLFAVGGFGVDLADTPEAALYTTLKTYAGY